MDANQTDGATEYLGDRIRRIATADHVDARGWLCPIDFSAFCFHPIRAFAVAAHDGMARGGHAHRESQQLFMLISGRIDVEFSDGHQRGQLQLTETSRAILIQPRIWTRQIFHGVTALLMVFSDRSYDPDSYIHSEADLDT